MRHGMKGGWWWVAVHGNQRIQGGASYGEGRRGLSGRGGVVAHTPRTPLVVDATLTGSAESGHRRGGRREGGTRIGTKRWC